MESNKKTARLAGFYYLLVVVFSILYMEYIPSKIVVWDDPEATINNLLSFETLYRVGIVIGILVHISFILLPITLYRLLSPVNKNQANLMVVFALISVPISYGLLLEQVNILDVIKSYDTLSDFGVEQASSRVMTFYNTLFNGFFLSQVFWGLWLFPFGYLVFKSGFLPKTLGVFLMLGCISYLIDVFGGTLIPSYYDYVNTRILIIPASIGEIGICLWLLIIGTKENIKY